MDFEGKEETLELAVDPGQDIRHLVHFRIIIDYRTQSMSRNLKPNLVRKIGLHGHAFFVRSGSLWKPHVDRIEHAQPSSSTAMSQGLLAIVICSLSYICGRTVVLSALPEYAPFISGITGIIAGVAIYQVTNDQHEESLLGVIVCTALDLFAVQKLAWSLCPVVGWLVAFGVDQGTKGESTGKSKRESHRRRSKKEIPGHRASPSAVVVSSSSNEERPSGKGTSHARVNFAKIVDTSRPDTTAKIVPLTEENIRIISGSPSLSDDDSDSTEKARQTSRRSSFVTAKSRPGLSPSRQTSIPQELIPEDIFDEKPRPTLFDEEVKYPTAPEPIWVPQLIVDDSMSHILVRVHKPEFYDVDYDSSDEEFVEVIPDDRFEEMILDDRFEEVIPGDRFNETSARRAIEKRRLEALLHDPLETASNNSSTVRGSEITGTIKAIDRRAEAYRTAAAKARKKASALRAQHKDALQKKRMTEAFSLKHAIKEAEAEVHKADRKASKLYYRGKFDYIQSRRESHLTFGFISLK